MQRVRQVKESSGAKGSTAQKQGNFSTTRWSVVAAAGKQSSETGLRALQRLCQTYWQPVYAFIRRWGHNPEDARDLTQEFFAYFIGGNSVARADPNRGRFRSFLFGALKHFLINELQRNTAQKRAGNHNWLSLDTQLAEEHYGLQQAGHATPDQEYDRVWAMALLERALQRLREEYALSGRQVLFEGLKGFLVDDSPFRSFAEVAAHLKITESAAKMNVTRMRQRFRQLLRQELAHTVLTASDFEEELRDFAAILRG